MQEKFPAPPQILIVDDSIDTLDIVRHTLQGAGFAVIPATSGEDALNILYQSGIPHLAIVDYHMPPGMTGFAFAEQVLQFVDLPIVMLTVVDEEERIVEAIANYAEDYMTKPFIPGELVARVHTVLNRIGLFPFLAGPLVRIDPRLQVYFARRRLIFDDQHTVVLTPTETKLLYMLLRHVGEIVTSDYLQRRMWPREMVSDDRLHVHIHRLRGKVRKVQGAYDHEYIISEKGIGFRFRPGIPSIPSA